MNYNEILAEKATTLAQLATDDGKQAKVVGFSLLQELVNEALQRQVREDLIPGSSFGEGSLYNALSDSTVAQLAEVLQSVSNVTFNDAVPMIKTIMEKMRQVMNPDIPVAYSTCDVKPVIYDEIWDTPLVMDLSVRGRNVFPSSVSLTGMIRNVLDEAYANLGELAMSGLPSVDEKLTSIISGYEGTRLTSLFADVFTSGWLPSENPSELILSERYSDKNDWIIITMWARNLRDIAPKDSAVGLDRYKMNLTALEEKAARVISGIDELRRVQSETDILILDVRGNTIYVNSDLYTNFLSKEVGGTPEAVLGVFLQDSNGRRQISSAQVLADKDQLEKAWNRHVAITTVKHGEQMASTARRQLHLIIDQAAAERVTANKLNKDDLGPILNKIAEEIRKLPADFTVDTHRWVFDIVGRVFYPNSNVGMLLTNLREVGDIKDSGFSAEEIRVVAVINFMGDWLGDCVTLVDHGGGVGPGNYTSYIGAMALEKLEGVPGNIKEWAQLIGLMILGAGVGYAIGTLLNKLIYGKDKSDKTLKIMESLADQGIVEVSRADLIESLKAKDDGDGVPALVMHTFNEDGDYQKLVAATEVLNRANLTGLVLNVKDLMAEDPSRNDAAAKSFMYKAEKLIQDLGKESFGTLKQIGILSGVGLESGMGTTTNPNAPASEFDEQLVKLEEAIETMNAKYGVMVGLDKLKKDGTIKVAKVLNDVRAMHHAVDQQAKGLQDLTKSTKATMDGDSLKEFKASDDAHRNTVERLSAALSLFSKANSALLEVCMVPLMAAGLFARAASEMKK